MFGKSVILNNFLASIELGADPCKNIFLFLYLGSDNIIKSVISEAHNPSSIHCE